MTALQVSAVAKAGKISQSSIPARVLVMILDAYLKATTNVSTTVMAIAQAKACEPMFGADMSTDM